jgi:Protein of unknown function (DUF664)
MPDNDVPWEPPFAGTEAEQLVGALDRQRATFRWKAADLGPEGLSARFGASTLTLGALLKHLALQEDHSSGGKLSGAPLGEPWASADWDSDPDWEMTSAASDSPDELYALYDAAVVRSRARFTAALADGGPEQFVHITLPDGRRVKLRRLLCDLLEEYARHTGHADLLREAVDGRVGEDPPDDWQPPFLSGRLS